MDWKQFFASVIGSLAWPLVLIVLLIFLRKHLAGMADRLEELTFPGGAKAKFDKQLDAARQESEKVVLDKTADGETVPSSQANDAQLANSFPEAAVIEAFRRLEIIIQLISTVRLTREVLVRKPIAARLSG